MIAGMGGLGAEVSALADGMDRMTMQNQHMLMGPAAQVAMHMPGGVQAIKQHAANQRAIEDNSAWMPKMSDKQKHMYAGIMGKGSEGMLSGGGGGPPGGDPFMDMGGGYGGFGAPPAPGGGGSFGGGRGGGAGAGRGTGRGAIKPPSGGGRFGAGSAGRGRGDFGGEGAVVGSRLGGGAQFEEEGAIGGRAIQRKNSGAGYGRGEGKSVYDLFNTPHIYAGGYGAKKKALPGPRR